MSRFNTSATNPRKTKNFEGASAFTLSPEMELYSLVCTTSLQNKFYESSGGQLSRLRNLLSRVDPLFVCKLAVYAREKMYLRSIPLVLMVELFKSLNGIKDSKKRDGTLLRKATTRVIQRADEITEILAYYSQANGRTATKKLNKLPNAMKKGIAEAFSKFNAYSLAKYNQDKEIKLRDALFLSHAKVAKDGDTLSLKKLVDKSLAAPDTWEVAFSQLGQKKFASESEKKKAFEEKWSEFIAEEKLGYMACLRNLRNILTYGAGKETLKKVCEFLSDENQVLKSKQLPFRFFSAYRELVSSNSDPFAIKQITKALEAAIKVSVKNLRGFDEETRVLIACDVSGSMQTPVSAKSTVENYDIGLLLGQLLQYRCKNVVTGFFGDSWKITDIASPNVLENTLALRRREGEVGYSTNGFLVIADLIKRNIEVDKIFMFTDCQLWNSLGSSDNMSQQWSIYKKMYPNAKMYLFDLAGHGSAPIDVMADKSVSLISGWSEKVFEVLDSLEKGKNLLEILDEIRL